MRLADGLLFAAVLTALCCSDANASSQAVSPQGLPDETVFRELVRDLAIAVESGDFASFRGELVMTDKYGEKQYALARSLGHYLPTWDDSEGAAKFAGGRVTDGKHGQNAIFPIVQVEEPSEAAMAQLRATYDQLGVWMREELGAWQVEEVVSQYGTVKLTMLTARTVDFESAPRIELSFVDYVRTRSQPESHWGHVLLTGRMSRLPGGLELSLLKEWGEADLGGAGTRGLLAWAKERDLGPEARLVYIGKRKLAIGGKAEGNEMIHLVGSLAWRGPTPLVFGIGERMFVDTYPAPPAADDPGAKSAREHFPAEASFRRVVRGLLDNAFIDYDPLRGPNIGAACSALIEPLGSRLPRAGKDQAEEALFLRGSIVSISSGLDQAEVPILELEGVNRHALQQLEEGFDELATWFKDEAGTWEIDDHTAEKLDGEHVVSRERSINLRTRPRSEDAWREMITLSLNESFSTSEDGVPLANVRIRVFGLCSRMGSGLDRHGLQRFEEEGSGFLAAKTLVTWMDEKGFTPESEIVRIGAADVTWALREQREKLLAQLGSKGVTRIMVKHLGRFEYHDFVGSRIAMPELPELHERFVDGRLDAAAYLAFLRTAPWSALEDFGRRLKFQQDDGLTPLFAGPLGPDGRVALTEGPLGSGRDVDLQWARLDGDGLAFAFVLGRSKRGSESQSALYDQLRALVRESLAGLGQLGARVELSSDTWGTRDLGLKYLLLPADREQVVLAIRVGAPAVARALRAELALQFEPIGTPVSDGWGKLRHRESGFVVEGVLRGGVPEGPGRLVDPSTGRVVVARLTGIEPSGPAILLEPETETCVRGRLADGRLADREALPAWKGIDGKGPYQGLDFLEKGPIVLARGSVRNGSASSRATGKYELNILGVGTYTGNFVDGSAEGPGVLRKPSGIVQEIECRGGVPAVVRTLVCPNGERRVYRERFGSALLPQGDCLEGNAIDGQATFLLQRDNQGHDFVYTGPFRDRKMHGQGVLEQYGMRWTGNFSKGQRDGIFTIEYLEGAIAGTVSKLGYRMGRFDPTYNDVPATAPAAVRADPRRVEWLKPAAPMVYSCVTCGGSGVARYNPFDYDNSTTPFMPGDRHYGSWIFTGYRHEDPYRTTPSSNRSGVCSHCGGTGTIRY